MGQVSYVTRINRLMVRGESFLNLGLDNFKINKDRIKRFAILRVSKVNIIIIEKKICVIYDIKIYYQIWNIIKSLQVNPRFSLTNY